MLLHLLLLLAVHAKPLSPGKTVDSPAQTACTAQKGTLVMEAADPAHAEALLTTGELCCFGKKTCVGTWALFRLLHGNQNPAAAFTAFRAKNKTGGAEHFCISMKGLLRQYVSLPAVNGVYPAVTHCEFKDGSDIEINTLYSDPNSADNAAFKTILDKYGTLEVEHHHFGSDEIAPAQ